MTAKHCNECELPKMIEEFDRRLRDTGRLWVDAVCAGCRRLRKRRSLASRTAGNPEAWFVHNMARVKHRAERIDVACDIDVPYLMWLYKRQQGKCAETGVPLTFILGRGRVPTNCSVDRLDNEDGYMRGNVRLTCVQANVSRGEMAPQEALSFYCTVLEHHGYEVVAPGHSSAKRGSRSLTHR